MVDETQAADPVVDVPTAEDAAPAPVVVISLEILALTKDAQNQNGMRDGNYEKYRQFCARKLARLRNGVGIKINKSKHKTSKRYPTTENVKDSRALQLLLFDAERAWAYAMELKANMAAEPRKRHHMVARLRKATRLVDQLEQLAATVTCDARTNLEISAYRTWLHGVLSFELQQWQDALDKLATARAVYERMASIGNPGQRALCHARVEEIEPSLRYCAYNIEAQSGAATTMDLSQLVKLRSQMSAAGLTALADKFEELMVSSGGSTASTASVAQTITLGSRTVPVQNGKVQELVQQSRQMHEAIDATADKVEKVGLFDRLLMLLSDAARLAAADIKENNEAQARAKSELGKDTTLELQTVHSAILYERAQRAIERTTIMAELASGTADAPILYNTLVQSWSDAKALPLVDQEPSIVALADASMALNRAQKCLQLADAREAAGKPADATALLQRAIDVLTEAAPTSTDDAVKAVAKQMTALETTLRARIGIARASAVLGNKDVAAAPAASTKKTAQKGALVELDELHVTGVPGVVPEHPPRTLSLETPNLLDIPAKFVAMPVKPIFFDLAERYVDYPEVHHKASSGHARAPQARTESTDDEEQDQGQQQGGLKGYLSSWWGGKK